MNPIVVSPRHFLVLPAAGSGRRTGLSLPKQFVPLAGKPILQHTLERFAALPEIAAIVLAVDEQDVHTRDFLAALPAALRKRVVTVRGGTERMYSVLNALEYLAAQAADDDWVLVHDAVRPCLRRSDIHKLFSALEGSPGGLLALPVRDTLKRADAQGQVLATLDRSQLWQAATPQMFRHGLLLRALREAAAAGIVVTDEAGAVERLGVPVQLVQGQADNIKVTWPEDLRLAEALLPVTEEHDD